MALRAIRSARTHLQRSSYTTHGGDQARAEALAMALHVLADSVESLSADMAEHLEQRRKRSPAWQETKKRPGGA